MYGCRADLGMVFWGSYTQGKTEVRSRNPIAIGSEVWG